MKNSTMNRMLNYNGSNVPAVNRKGNEIINMMFADMVVTLSTTFDEYVLCDHGTTKRDNDGIDLNGTDIEGNNFPFVEVYNNSDMRTPNIAFRPHPSIRKKLGLTQDNNGVDGVKWTHPKNEITERYVIPLKSVVSFMDILSQKAIMYLDNEREEKKHELDEKKRELDKANKEIAKERRKLTGNKKKQTA